MRLIDADAYGEWLQKRREQARADGDMAMYGLRSAKLHLDAAPTACCEECKWSEDGRLGPLDELCGVPGCEDFGCAYFERRTT